MARGGKSRRGAGGGGAGRRRWLLYGALGLAAFLAAGGAAVGYTYVTLSRLIEARLSGERERTLPRVFARPFELRRGQALTIRELVERLNDLSYTLRAEPTQPGEFAIGPNLVMLIPREGPARGRRVRVQFAARGPRRDVAPRVERIEVVGHGASTQLNLGTPLLTALITTGREKRRQVPLAQIPPRMVQAVLAIEDRRFYDHPGVDPLGILRALWTNLRGERPYLVGGSTLTQQLVKNLFLRPEKTLRRKLIEQAMALILEQRLSKDDILELYLNEVYLGQRGSFAIHGVAEAARLFFGKDVSNVTLGEAATIAGVIQAPQLFSPFRNLARARARRDVVLHAMVEAGYIPADEARRAAREPLVVVERAIENEAPYFVDYVSEQLEAQFPELTRQPGAVDVYTTVDVHLQRLAQEAVAEGLARVDRWLARRREAGAAQAALIAVDVQTGDILALVGGRSYSASQYNRAVFARRQPGSVFKPFVYLAAFEQAASDGATDLTPATVVVDEPTAFWDGERAWTPANYGGEYDGPITLRRALALSRNVATVKVAERAGFDQVAALWRRIGTGTVVRPYPSIALGVFEASPLEIATAYTLFPNGGVLRPLRALVRIVHNGRELLPPVQAPRRIARPDTTFLVTHMMRSVLNEGTGASARANGFTLDAAGKSGTTNDLRDAWFVGFTRELLTVVWVGLDDNRPLGLSGTQAALPIWTAFMRRALAGHPDLAFEVPEGIAFAEIDPDTGALATPACPRRFTEAFLVGTVPSHPCAEHPF
jgi:penicillin-binding protein 1B